MRHKPTEPEGISCTIPSYVNGSPLCHLVAIARQSNDMVMQGVPSSYVQWALNEHRARRSTRSDAQEAEQDLPLAEPAVPKFMVGDVVSYTNDYGVCFENKTVTQIDFVEGKPPRYFYTPSDSPWFSVRESGLAPVQQAICLGMH
ncbi:MAG: hypothetical protein Q7S87_09930 [Agitococcus sp.]|nr:hypothetical protein [Agitococcus sp.]MDO9179349.1 hypothetical protein [Agitococcus sp.]